MGQTTGFLTPWTNHGKPGPCIQQTSPHYLPPFGHFAQPMSICSDGDHSMPIPSMDPKAQFSPQKISPALRTPYPTHGQTAPKRPTDLASSSTMCFATANLF